MINEKMITIGITTEEPLNQAFIDAWHRVEQEGIQISSEGTA
ncbi:hypothetical protein U27_04042 [Candidatus Vecturithrix granuli]|uniref:Uncharacterized protein n=1 Tax=Vecturithrix granuli TaxID=1499967 RepID=A0A081BXM3_VECG1|nr:hypothetical protein U27_04042 [Candidatus Vecturithrix granuli]